MRCPRKKSWAWRPWVWGTMLSMLVLLPGCDDEDPVRSPPPAITFDAPDPFCSIDNSTCEATADISFAVGSGFQAEALTFDLQLDAGADGTIDEMLDPNTVLTRSHPDYVVETEMPFGDHELLVEMTDGDGMTHMATIPFSVLDCRAPAPICINGLVVELQPLPPETDADGDSDFDAAAMTIFASDFIASPVSDCSEPVRYSINRSGEPASVDTTSLVLTCNDVGTVVVEIHGWDSASGPGGGPNHDFCETYILVQDSRAFCSE